MVLREMGSGLLWALVVLVVLAVGGAEVYEHFTDTELYPSDNPVEEAVEELIEDKTGVDIDLSPLSAEK